MGWASGSELAGDLVEVIKNLVHDKEDRAALYYHLIDKFEQHDCDTMDECLGIDAVYDKVFFEMYPEWND